MTIKNGDFIEMDFVAKLKNTNQVFDTTFQKIADENHFHREKAVYKPYVFCVGEGHVLPGIEQFLIGKDVGSYKVEIPAELAFGKKNAKLLRLVSKAEFHKHKIEPVPGLEIELDDQRGIVRSVGGGRVIVDFNHPLSSQDVVYDITINRILTDSKEKIEAVLHAFKIPFTSVEFNGETAKIIMPGELPGELTKPIAEEIVRLTGVKDIIFSK